MGGKRLQAERRCVAEGGRAVSKDGARYRSQCEIIRFRRAYRALLAEGLTVQEAAERLDVPNRRIQEDLKAHPLSEEIPDVENLLTSMEVAAAVGDGRFDATPAREPGEGDDLLGGSTGTPAASPFDESVPVLPADEAVPSEEALVPAQPVSDSAAVSAQTAEMTVSSPPRMSIPRPRMSVPRPLAATGD